MEASLQHTPTWAAAVIFFFAVAVSYILAQSISFAGNWFRSHQKIALYDAIDKLKEELMILGFLSLVLAVVQRPISHICVPAKAADFMLPCRRLHPDPISSAAGYCVDRGMISLVSQQGVHQLHIFIFVLAVVHVLCSVTTMILGRAKMRRWKAWEKETQTTEYHVANDPNRFRLTRETTFAKRHISGATSSSSMYLWIKCFFRQFYDSVNRVDYLTLRHGFIMAHFSRHTTFNFHEYTNRSLEDEFKTVLRIRVVFLLLAVICTLDRKYNSTRSLGALPPSMSNWPSLSQIVLAVGTKLHVIVARMAVKLDREKIVITGAPPVQPNDDFFWFGNPRLILFLLHLAFFQNAFELTFFIWIWVCNLWFLLPVGYDSPMPRTKLDECSSLLQYEFGLKSCYHENFGITIARVTLAVVVQFLCSYITLPMYALVTQMGSEVKRSMFGERTKTVLRRWHEDVRVRRKKQHPRRSPPSTVSQLQQEISMQISSST
ncbi:May be involved in modulation of pathogen defense and leaf cell death [Musa troglodytarum]|uniref:MLO-like protein n=1 Tax=Musa troglodytarum TaxID=320322 RepID=A0A9E7G4L7_9LILI|nr:May be involved in modulation of pathogen defense and leaf cell death [Musa troglodytarum]